MTVWLIEGLPGAGKTTLAEHLCSLAKNSKWDAKWYLEESDDHPVHSKFTKAKRREGQFIEECLRAWSRFTERYHGNDTVQVLEGSAFQSTVRFMMEERLTGIKDYYLRFEELIEPLNPRMVYLRPLDALGHSKFVAESRGKIWTTKVSGYLEKTPYAVHQGLVGVDGMHRFWADYAALCDEVIASTQIPTMTINFSLGDWERHIPEAARFLGLLGYETSPALSRFNTPLDVGTAAYSKFKP